MPSKAYETFQANLEQADRILKESSIPQKRGRRRLNHFNRSALIILCGSWEQYVEDVVLESVAAIIACTDDPRDLPQSVQKNIYTAIVTSSEKNLTALEATIADWRNIYKETTQQAVKHFNSPTCSNINILLSENIGVSHGIFSKPDRSKDSTHLDQTIEDRNMIAHHGVGHGEYIVQKQVTKSMDVISRLAKTTDNHLYERLPEIYSTKIPLWKGKVE